MDNFCQFWNRLNGEPYTDGVPAPVKYDLATMDVGQVCGTTNGSHELRPLADEDMGTYAADDVVAHYVALHKGKNPLRLGDPMSDEELKKFYGQTW